MVLQGEKNNYSMASASMHCGERDPAARKASFEAVQRKEQERKAKEEESKKYGAWGSVYKNKQNFVNMHIC